MWEATLSPGCSALSVGVSSLLPHIPQHPALGSLPVQAAVLPGDTQQDSPAPLSGRRLLPVSDGGLSPGSHPHPVLCEEPSPPASLCRWRELREVGGSPFSLCSVPTHRQKGSPWRQVMREKVLRMHPISSKEKRHCDQMHQVWQ